MNLTGLFRKSIDFSYDKKRPIRSFICKVIRITYLSIRSFYNNDLYLKSSLLTFYSLISIVPILAIVLAVAKGFGFEEFLQKEILQTFKEQQNIITITMTFAYAFIGHIQSQAVVGIGVIFLFFSIIGLFENIEKSLNTIWRVKKTRSLVRRWFNYILALIFFPIIFLASTSITIFINSEAVKIMEHYEFLKAISGYVLTIFKWTPYGLMCLAFIYLYVFTPNTKISLKPRIFAGILAGIIFQLWQIIYIDFQVYISSYSIIYGSFAALPLFLIWMQINFVILLFGGEIAAQIEGDRFFKKYTSDVQFTYINQKYLGLLVLYEITSHFLKGEGPLSIEHISEHLGISLLEAREVLDLLEKTKLIAEITGAHRSLEQYQLIVNPELFTVQAICNLLDTTLLKRTKAMETKSLYVTSHWFTNLESLINKSEINLSLKDFSNIELQ